MLGDSDDGRRKCGDGQYARPPFHCDAQPQLNCGPQENMLEVRTPQIVPVTPITAGVPGTAPSVRARAPILNDAIDEMQPKFTGHQQLSVL